MLFIFTCLIIYTLVLLSYFRLKSQNFFHVRLFFLQPSTDLIGFRHRIVSKNLFLISPFVIFFGNIQQTKLATCQFLAYIEPYLVIVQSVSVFSGVQILMLEAQLIQTSWFHAGSVRLLDRRLERWHLLSTILSVMSSCHLYFFSIQCINFFYQQRLKIL